MLLLRTEAWKGSGQGETKSKKEAETTGQDRVWKIALVAANRFRTPDKGDAFRFDSCIFRE